LFVIDGQGQPVYMQGGQGGQTVDANGMVRRVAYPPQQYVMANGQAVPAGAHRGQGQQVIH
jgi:hypothetical protein